MDLANIIYKYINRFINSDELISLIENIDKSNFSKSEVKNIENLLQNIKEVIRMVPNEIDEIEKNRINNINHMVELLEKNLDNDNLNEDEHKVLEKQYNTLLLEKDKIKDCGLRYQKLFELLNDNSIFIKNCEKMNSLELLEFITQYISVPLPPNINQETFNDLVKVGIEKDKREALWRLAFNYNNKEKDFSMIEDYFILKRDAYYLTELVSAVIEDLDLNRLVDKVIETKDKEFINEIIKKGYYLKDFFSEEAKEKLSKFRKEEKNEEI